MKRALLVALSLFLITLTARAAIPEPRPPEAPEMQERIVCTTYIETKVSRESCREMLKIAVRNNVLQVGTFADMSTGRKSVILTFIKVPKNPEIVIGAALAVFRAFPGCKHVLVCYVGVSGANSFEISGSELCCSIIE